MTHPNLDKLPKTGHGSASLFKALAGIDRERIAKDIDAGQWTAASREEVVRAANKSLEGSGLAICLSMGDLEPYGEERIKYTVSGWITHESGERMHLHWMITGPLTAPRMQTQADGAAYTYAAKNCIFNALSLARGGEEASELAHLGGQNDEREIQGSKPSPRVGRPRKS
tara:strand:+ start:1326 stop:1835 length:510 start_codon:yes stop_codon:yes gene_type:complete